MADESDSSSESGNEISDVMRDLEVRTYYTSTPLAFIFSYILTARGLQ